MTSLAQAESERLRGVDARQAELGAALESQVDRLSTSLEGAGDAVARVSADNADVRRSQEELTGSVHDALERLQRLEAAVDSEAARGPDEAERLEVLQRRVEEAVEGRVDGIEARQAVLDASVGQLRLAMEARADQAGAAVARVSLDNEELSRVVHGVHERLAQLQLTVDAEAARARSESAARDDGARKALRNGELLQERLARLAGAAEADAQRLEGVESVVEEWTERVESGQREVGVALESSVEQLGAALSGVRLDNEQVRSDVDGVLDRLQQLTSGFEAEKPRVAPEDAGRMTEAMESLRRELLTALSDGLAEVRSSSATGPAEQIARIHALEQALAQRDSDVSDLFELQAALDTSMGRLHSDVAAARGSLDASSLGPLRSDVKALQDQIAAQNVALLALKRSVESLRRKSSGGATLAPKKAPKKTK